MEFTTIRYSEGNRVFWRIFPVPLMIDFSPMEPSLTSKDWQRLRTLRERYLTDASEEYWTERDLELYDATFAQRIGWKWDAVLADLTVLGWKPQASRLFDWGCGTGIAARAVTAWTGINTIEVFDQSRLAMSFSVNSLKQQNGAARARQSPAEIEPGTLLVLSHVIGELSDAELTRLAGLAATAEELIWVEPGSREISRRLSSVRETLRQAGHQFIGPCTHQNSCPMLEPANERHWCHFFARPPMEVFQSAFWRRFSEEVEVDLRGLPYSYLASSRLQPATVPVGAERLIARPVELKAHSRLLCCGAEGLQDRVFQKRTAPDLYRRIIKKSLDGAFVWQLDSAGQITGGGNLAD